MAQTFRSHYRYKTISELHELMRRGVEADDIADAASHGLESAGRALNAVAELNPAAVSDARRTDRGLSLAGIPYGIKDVFDTAGIATRFGAPPFVDNVPRRDAGVVERLREAGAVLAAKLSPIQLAGAGGYRFPSTSLEGPGHNPWSQDRWSGGSSSGSASAVGAGLLPFTIGSETTGSVVVPAAFCGVTGFRPSWGSVTQYGMLVVAWSIDKPGVIARSAADCAMVFKAIAGPDSRDPATAGAVASPPIALPLRIGVLDVDFDGFPHCRQRFEEALRTLKSAGMKVRQVSLPGQDYRSVLSTIQSSETAGSQEALIRSGQLAKLLDSAQRDGLRRALRVKAAEYARANHRRVGLVAGLRSVFRDVDALVAPTSLSEAPPIRTDLKRWAPRRKHYGWLGALAGLPGVTVPMGFGPNHLPLGLSVVTDHGMDLTALAIAEDYQGRTDWHMRTPPVAQ